MSPKNKHLTDACRLKIEHMLREGAPLARIADAIGKHPSTITREIRNRSVKSDKGAAGRATNRCVHRKTCKKKQLCMDKPDCVRHCPACPLCNTHCDAFVEETCRALNQPPYVCNGCKQEHICVLKKKFYIHAPAHKKYREILVGARDGANITEPELAVLNTLLAPLVKNGQSIHHVVVNNPNRFNVHEKTIYRYVHGGLLQVKRGDMPRVCMLKPRKRKPVEHKVDTQCRIGRTYDDFKAFMAENPGTPVIEMDTVKGGVAGKCLLTLQFVNTSFMLAFLRGRNDAQSVIEAFNMLWETAEAIQPGLFKRLLPVLLTDNGSEFSNPLALEFAPDGTRRTRVFYCNPCASWQKPHVENNHAFVRLICPKGASFDGLVQADVATALSHINSYTRRVLNDKAPFDLFTFLYGVELPHALDVRRLSANDIILKPFLLD